MPRQLDNPHTEGRTRGAALATLSAAQVRSLVLLAREAYSMEFPEPEMDFDAWRHRQCLVAVERGGLTQCRNEDYLPLKAHLLRLAGRDEEADRADTRAAVEPRTWALHAFERECSAVADVLPAARNYAAGFLRNKRSVAIEDASDKDLWSCVYLLRRRAEQLRKKGA
jgi:hypothetical protein